MKQPVTAPDTRITVRLPKSLRKKLKSLARADGRTENSYVRFVLTQHANTINPTVEPAAATVSPAAVTRA